MSSHSQPFANKVFIEPSLSGFCQDCCIWSLTPIHRASEDGDSSTAYNMTLVQHTIGTPFAKQSAIFKGSGPEGWERKERR